MPRNTIGLTGLDEKFMTVRAPGMTELDQGKVVRLDAGPNVEPQVSVGNDEIFGKVLSVEVSGGVVANPLLTIASVQYRGMAEVPAVEDGNGDLPVARDLVSCTDTGAVVKDPAGNKTVIAIGSVVAGQETVFIDLG